MNFKEELKEYIQIINIELEKHLRKQECLESVLNASMY